jgi:hypothetical protein
MGSVLLIFLVFCVSVCVCVCVCAGFVSLVASVSGLCTIGGPSILSNFYLNFFIFMHGVCIVFFIRIVPLISYCPRLITYCVGSIFYSYLFQ